MGEQHGTRGFHGPKCWAVSALAGALIGVVIALLAPAPTAVSGVGVANSHPGVIERGPDGTETVVYPVPAGAGTSSKFKVQSSKGSAAEVSGHAAPVIPLWLCVPFALLLLSIATMPFVNERLWHDHYPDFAFFFASMVAAYYLATFGNYGRHAMGHAGLEYYSFIALVGGLYVVSGGILVRVRARGSAVTNTALLAVGAVLANVVGTTGASVLLIRPFMRMNEGRLRAVHIVFFIFIVSNCGGCLTPIGDPPLYLGYLKGVPFFWTATHLWPMWAAAVGMLLVVFFVIDSFMGSKMIAKNAEETKGPKGDEQRQSGTTAKRHIGGVRGAVSVSGATAIVGLGLLVAGVFVDPVLKRYAGIEGWPIGATVQVVVAAAAWRVARREIHGENAFNFHPVKEVGLLFVGIFATMVPALGYLSANGPSLGLESATQYYFSAGVLSAVLDNAPTYVSFLQLSFSVIGFDISPETVHRFIENTYVLVHADSTTRTVQGQVLLEAISLGAVFFGALTYIGNGPNFMVKAIADSSGKVRMPSFIGYVVLSAVILGPVLAVVWGVFIR